MSVDRKELQEPFKQAYEEMPRAWYELDHRGHVILTVGSALAIYYANIGIFHIDTPIANIGVAALYGISTLADRYSTILALRANERAEQIGIMTGGEEKNIFLRNITKPDQFISSRRAMLMDILGVAVSYITPGIGMGFVLGKVQAAANNLRKAQRINRAIEIASA